MIVHSQELALTGFLTQPAASPKRILFEIKPNRFFWKALIVLAVMCLSFVAAPAKGTVETNLTASNLLYLTNQDRERLGLKPFEQNLKLAKAARGKAQDMLKYGYFAHASPAGLEAWDFIKNAGQEYAFAGENLAINYTSSYELSHDFLLSPSHRDNILSPIFSETGIAVVEGLYQGQRATLTVQLFATP